MDITWSGIKVCDISIIHDNNSHSSLTEYHDRCADLNLNSLLVTRQMTLFHQGVRIGEKLVP